MEAMRRRTERTLHTLRETLEVTKRVRDTARVGGREEFARHEDEAIVELEKRIARLEQHAVEFEERQARRSGEA